MVSTRGFENEFNTAVHVTVVVLVFVHDLQEVLKADTNSHILQRVFDVEERLELPQEEAHFIVILVN